MKTYVTALLALLTGLWIVSLPGDAWPAASADFWALRKLAIYYTGIGALGLMSVALVLATRPRWLETPLGGLDRSYRLHKWLGIGATVLGFLHWMLKIVPKWMVSQGWLERAARKGSGGATDLLALLREPAESVGEWGIYLVLALVLLALWKRFPYRPAFLLHRALAATYLILVFHGAVLMPTGYWLTPLGATMAVLMGAGSLAAMTSLAGRIGRKRQATGTITALRHHRDNGVLEVDCRLGSAWPGHAAGQFAFLTLSPREGAHPYTIASAWRGDGILTFAIKGLGDYTRTLPQHLQVGAPVTVEGPYGRFDFSSRAERQVWVAGGIGITPFLARLEALAAQGGSTQPVDMFYCTAAADDGFIAHLRQLAEQARVRLHLLVTPRDGYLTSERLNNTVATLKDSDIWFCGPASFGQALRQGLGALGLSERRFHQEAFEMR